MGGMNRGEENFKYNCNNVVTPMSTCGMCVCAHFPTIKHIGGHYFFRFKLENSGVG